VATVETNPGLFDCWVVMTTSKSFVRLMIINYLKTLVEAADESFYTSVDAVMK